MSLIDRFMTDTYSVTRNTSGTYDKGFYVPGPKECIQVEGSMQPTNARELKLPEEGNRLKQYWKFYTDKPILTNNTRTLANSDIVVVNGDTYKVMSVEPWQGLGVDLPHYLSILYREPEQ